VNATTQHANLFSRPLRVIEITVGPATLDAQDKVHSNPAPMRALPNMASSDICRPDRRPLHSHRATPLRSFGKPESKEVPFQKLTRLFCRRVLEIPRNSSNILKLENSEISANTHQDRYVGISWQMPVLPPSLMNELSHS